MGRQKQYWLFSGEVHAAVQLAPGLVDEYGFDLCPDGTITARQGHRNAEVKAFDLIAFLAKLLPGAGCPGPLLIHDGGDIECHHSGCPGITAAAHGADATERCGTRPALTKINPCGRCAA